MQKNLFIKSKPYRFRILAGALFCAFLISTWFIFHQKPKYPEELHISLQDQLKNIIQETLTKQNPQAKNLKFQRMWTQSTKKQDQISAYFQYSFDDEADVNISIEGQALMNRKSLGSSENHDLWSVDHIKINSQKMEFSEPITFLSGKFKNQDEWEEREDDSYLEETTNESALEPSIDNKERAEKQKEEESLSNEDFEEDSPPNKKEKKETSINESIEEIKTNSPEEETIKSLESPETKTKASVNQPTLPADGESKRPTEADEN